MSEILFSYGTLQLEAVQMSTFGRKLTGEADAIIGYKLSMLEIQDEEVVALSGQKYHPVIAPTGNPGDSVDGTAFLVTPEELLHADDYEVDDYKRVQVDLKSGRKGWVYVKA